MDTRLDEGVGKTLLERSLFLSYINSKWRWRDDRKRPAVKGAIWQERCLMLSIPAILRSEEKESAMLVVIDRNSGRPFAYYELGDYYHNFPPVEWKPD